MNNNEWRPIETAPFDDTMVLIFMPSGCQIWVDLIDHDSTPDWWRSRGVTHWMPLPEPPQ